ncbi:Gas2l1p [Blomia tropicalis]|nr:Gas2l1p [Blomia tropicalis]
MATQSHLSGVSTIGETQWAIVNGCSSLSSSNSFAMDSLASSQSSTIDSMDEPKRAYSACALSLSDTEFGHFERKPYRPFRSNEEYLVAMKEDLAEWLNTLYTGLDMSADNFLNRLETGVILCRHANSVLRKARDWKMQDGYSRDKKSTVSLIGLDLERDVPIKTNAPPGTFQARDNVANFINWCRRIRIHECLLFETEDLVSRKNEKSFVLCLLEVARFGASIGLLAPTLVQFEQEIDQEMENEQKGKRVHSSETESLSSSDDGLFVDETPHQQITNNDLESLHEKILRNHVMVRVGGGWDTLEHYLEKHDPCRCRFGHRHHSNGSRVALNHNHVKSHPMQVTYDRPDITSSQTRRNVVNMSPSSARRLVRPNSVSTNLSSSPDLVGIRRASTSSNDSTSSMCSSSMQVSQNDKCDSFASSGHSSLSSSHSLSSFSPAPIIPDRNNNVRGLANGSINRTPASLQTKPISPNKKRILSTPENISRIPKSKIGASVTSLKPMSNSLQKSTLTASHKMKSTSSLAISQLSSSSSKIPCLDATNKVRPTPTSRYSTHNIYLAVSQESDNLNKEGRYTRANKTRTRTTTNLCRTKPKSSLELNIGNENYYSLSSINRGEQVPNNNISKSAKVSQQNRRHHSSSSSLPRVTKSAHNSPYTKRREMVNGGNSTSSSSSSSSSNPIGTNATIVADDTPRHMATKIGANNDGTKRFQGSATSLNSTASTASGSTNSSSDNSLNTTVATVQSQVKANFLESPNKSFVTVDKTPSATALVEVCSWLERNHLNT